MSHRAPFSPWSKAGFFVACFGLLGAPAVAAAQDVDDATPAAYQAVIACRDIPDPAARLACFDENVATLDKAKQDEDLVIVSREEVRKTRRGLFGLSIPSLRLFGGGDGDEKKEAITEIDSTIASFSRAQSGYVFVLEDGAVWVQTDRSYINKPVEGMPIHIERAAMGSYFARVNDGVAIRVKRRN